MQDQWDQMPVEISKRMGDDDDEGMKAREQEEEDGLWAEKMKAFGRDHLSQNFGGESKVYVSGGTCQWRDREAPSTFKDQGEGPSVEPGPQNRRKDILSSTAKHLCSTL